MNKRGVSRSLFLVGEIVGAALVAVLLISNAMQWTSTERPYKEYLAKDIALSIDSIFASPGNIIVNYTGNLTDYSVDLTGNSVSIYDDLKQNSEITRKFVPSENIEVNGITLEKPKNIFLAKAGDEIFISDSASANLNILNCDKLDEKEAKLKDKKILIDPGYGEGNIEESKKICNIGNSLISNMITEGFDSSNILSTIKFDEGETRSLYCDHISKSDASIDANAIISLRAGKYDNKKNSIKAFIISGSKKEKESKILACFIINSILGNKRLNDVNIDGTSIVPVDLETTNENFPKDIFLKNGEKVEDFKTADFDKIFVLLEIGNAESEQGKLLLEKIPELGNSIAKGLIDYGK
ncbi:MAG: hypothetical protein KJ968_03940 [Nanoarchaeota archaeon]|nr:hypothetical protein [Nanoarchaeota archaeon]